MSEFALLIFLEIILKESTLFNSRKKVSNLDNINSKLFFFYVKACYDIVNTYLFIIPHIVSNSLCDEFLSNIRPPFQQLSVKLSSGRIVFEVVTTVKQ